MNQQNEFLLPDKSSWMSLDCRQREALASKYVILCPPILFNEVARHGLNTRNALLNLDNIFAIPHWSKHAKMDLLKNESSKPILVRSESATRLIREYSEHALLDFKKISSQAVERLIGRGKHYRGLTSVIDPLKGKLLELVEKTEDLSDKEWKDKLEEVVREFQEDYPHPVYGRILKHIESESFPEHRVKPIQASIKALCDTFSANTLKNAYYLAVYLLKYNSSDGPAAYDTLQKLCDMFAPILTQFEQTQIFNRFLDEDMPPIHSFAPHALLAMIWYITIYLYLSENPENAARKNDLRDAEYMFYMFHKNLIFLSSDTSHRKFINDVPLFKPIRKNFIFVDNRTKETIQEGLSKILS